MVVNANSQSEAQKYLFAKLVPEVLLHIKQRAADAGKQPRPHMALVSFAVGGAMGYIRKGSTKSLGGGLSGALILALAARSMQGPGMQAGVRVAFGKCVTCTWS